MYIVIICPAEVKVFYVMGVFLRTILVTVLVKAILLSSNSIKLDLDLLT